MKRRNLLQVALIAVSVVLLLLGAQRGEMDTVWQKAINICLECIGIG